LLTSPPLHYDSFDLFFVILDECQAETDQLIAEHIVAVHQGRDDVVRPYFQPDQVSGFAF